MNKGIIVAISIVWGFFIGASAVQAENEADSRTGDKRGELVGAAGRGVYTRPVWRKMGKGTYVGGYIDMEFIDRKGANSEFDQHRLIPFIYADVLPGLRVATEIEFEHGATNNNQGDGDTKVEFAIIDYDLVGEHLGFRGGIILTPLGKFNSIHDSPMNDLTDRPLVSRRIIPTTLSEAGMGVFGTSYLDPARLDYELYLVNGFDGGADGTVFTPGGGLRSGRGSQGSDNNESKAVTGRLGVSPTLGSEVGFSFHSGAYDDSGNHNLTILAADWAFQWRNIEVLGEFANAQVEHGTGIAVTAVPSRMQGIYGQVNVHFLQDVIRQGSTFTGVFRADHIDKDVGDRTSVSTTNEQNRYTVGLNFRPAESSVFKLDYQWNYEAGEHKFSDNDAVLFSVATYF